MKTKNKIDSVPTLPQNVSSQAQVSRNFELSLARVEYNYMQSYLEPLAMAATVPASEGFSPVYKIKVMEVSKLIVENFRKVVVDILGMRMITHLPQIRRVKRADKEGDASAMDADAARSEGELTGTVNHALGELMELGKDIAKVIEGAETVYSNFRAGELTDILESTLFNLVRDKNGENQLRAKSLYEYDLLFNALPKPLTLSLKRQPWMVDKQKPWAQDWFFSYLQTAGFNTTVLKGVRVDGADEKHTVCLAELLKKFPITDAMFQAVTKEKSGTLHEAARQKHLFVCDYTMMEGVESNIVHGLQRYPCAPIALFYWNTSPPEGYPPEAGVLQPIAIQLGQQFDAETTPIFTPNDCSEGNDPHGVKWKIAKFMTNAVCAMHHESVAHFGACHLTVEPIVIATHRQLSNQHPLFQLLIPHFRFNLEINNTARNNLIVPGGVVATDVGLKLEHSLGLIVKSRAAWRWDDENPDQLFRGRGVDQDALPLFPFRDDTLLIWEEIKSYVGHYVRLYYPDDQTVLLDSELQAWINEVAFPGYGGFKGMNGLTATDNPKLPWQLDSRDYLIKIISHIIYIAGPQHAAVNYAQYPLMSYMPSVSGSIYHAAPTKSADMKSKDECLAWYPPLDISLYTFSFEYLLSGIQYDKFGYYNDDPRVPYFNDARAHEVNLDFQANLVAIESIIRQKNKTRAVPYLLQLPSLIPNSISI